MEINKINIENGEHLLVLHLNAEIAEKYNKILQTHNFTPSRFFNVALFLMENYLETPTNQNTK